MKESSVGKEQIEEFESLPYLGRRAVNIRQQ